MTNYLRNMNLASRLMIAIVSINVVTLLIIGVVALSSNQQVLEREARARFDEKNQQVAGLIHADLESVMTVTTQLQITLSGLNSYSEARIRAIIRDVTASNNNQLIQRINVYRPVSDINNVSEDSVVVIENFRSDFGYVDSIRVFTDDARQPALTAPMFDAINRQSPIWFIQERAYGDENGMGSISLAVPYNFNDEVQGVIWVDVPQSAFNTLFDEVVNQVLLFSDTDNGLTMLIDEDGNVLASIGERDVSLTMDIMDDMTTAFDEAVDLHGLRNVFDPTLSEQALIATADINIANWTLMSSFPIVDMPVTSGLLALQIIVISIAGITGMVLAIRHFANQNIVQPLMNLSRAAQEIGSGDLRYHIDYRGYDDEIGFLARAMEAMKGNIAHSYNELQTWSRTLEQRVYDRTRELNRAQKEAEAVADDLRAVYDESLLVVNEPTLEPILEALSYRMLSLLDAIYCSVWLLDDDGERIRLVTNTEDEDITEFSIGLKEGVVGQSIERQEIITVDDYSTYEHRVMLPYSDRLPYVRAIVAPLLFDGTPLGAVVVGRTLDAKPFSESETRLLTLFSNLISPAVRNAQLFNQREEARHDAERANIVKTRFLASVTHELRTPLNLIINNMDFMRIGAFGEVTDEQRSRLNQTVRSAEHLLYLINDLLDVSKIEAGEMQLFIQPSDVSTLIEDAVDTTYALMEKIEGKAEAVQLVIDVQADLPKIPIDARRIRQVLINLLSNAVKFTHEGEIKLVVKTVPTGIYFSVSDTGIGVPEDEIDLLFQAFERTTQAKEQAIEGTGLGLPISQFLVQQHGGELTVESVVGEGASFMFTLPLITPDVLDSGKTPIMMPTLKSKL